VPQTQDTVACCLFSGQPPSVADLRIGSETKRNVVFTLSVHWKGLRRASLVFSNRKRARFRGSPQVRIHTDWYGNKTETKRNVVSGHWSIGEACVAQASYFRDQNRVKNRGSPQVRIRTDSHGNKTETKWNVASPYIVQFRAQPGMFVAQWSSILTIHHHPTIQTYASSCGASGHWSNTTPTLCRFATLCSEFLQLEKLPHPRRRYAVHSKHPDLLLLDQYFCR
jgi:hypothetical protein